MIAQFVVLVLLVAAAVWAAAALVRWPWSLWVRAEQKQVLTHNSPTDTPAMLGVAGMWTVISLLLFSLYGLAHGDFPRAREFLDNPGDALTPLLGVFGGGVGLAMLAYGADVVCRWLGSKYRAFRSYRASRKASR